MSPTAFKQQLTHLLTTLTNCHTLCESIRQNRKLSSTNALDSLEDSIASCHPAILTTYSSLRKFHGSQMDQGDNVALNALNRIISNVQTDIESRLAALAHKKKEKGDGQKKPGFGEMDRKIVSLVGEVVDVLEGLGHRADQYEFELHQQEQQFLQQQQLEQEQQAKLEQKSQQQKKKQSHKSDEVVLSLNELDHFVQHMKNSWIEKSVDGQILYVNIFDDKLAQWERPSSSAFIQSLPEKKKSSMKAKKQSFAVQEEEDAEARRRKERKERAARETLDKERSEREAFERELREVRDREFRRAEEARAQQLYQQQQQQAHRQSRRQEYDGRGW